MKHSHFKAPRKLGKSIALSFALILGISHLATCQGNPDPDSKPKSKNIMIALILDTSNSMDGLIDQAKAQLWNVVSELSMAKCDGVAPNLKIALYEYGNSRLSGSEGFISMVRPLTNDLDAISASLFGLSTQGGSEFCGHAISRALNELDWSKDANDYKVIFIAGNEIFSQGDMDYKTVCKQAKQRGIIVNTIHCGGFQQGINHLWKDGADLAGGEYLAIDQNSKTQFIPSPFDDDIKRLNDSLNTTYLYYGTNGRKKYKQLESEDANASTYGLQNSVNRAVSKSSHVYRSSSWDLVEAVNDKDFKLEELDTTQIPVQMKTMNNVEREKYIVQNSKKRTKIKEDIQSLNAKRRDFVIGEEAKIKRKTQLGTALIKTVRDQAELLQFTFSNS